MRYVVRFVRCGGLLCSLLLAAHVQAQSPRDEAFVPGDDLVGFGARHQWVISSDAAMSVQQTSQSDTERGSITVTAAPAADFFVIENLSLGAAAGVQYARAGESHATRASAGPRLGYNVEITHLLSFWPRLGLSYSFSASEDAAARAQHHALGMNAFAPLMMHPVEHFFIGFGPFIDIDLRGDPRAQLWGGRMTLGGWL
jgi:hypothetical protein